MRLLLSRKKCILKKKKKQEVMRKVSERNYHDIYFKIA